MFAIIEDGSHQFRVQQGDVLLIDLRDGVQKGDALTFDQVLAAGNSSTQVIGRPTISGATVQAEIVDAEFRGPKIEVGKFRRRKSYIRHNGHIQRYVQVKITGFDVPGVAEDASAERTEQPAPATEQSAVEQPVGASS